MMKLTPKKTLLIILGEIGLVALIICLSLIQYTYFWEFYVSPYVVQIRNSFRYDRMHILTSTQRTSVYILLRIVENPDSTFAVFSSKIDTKDDKCYISLIKLDKNLKRISEKLIPGYVEFFPVDVSFDGEKYYLISAVYGKKEQSAKIKTISRDGVLLSDLDVKRDYKVNFNTDGYSVLQFLIRDSSAFIFFDDNINSKKILMEVDIRSGKVIKEYALPSSDKELKVSQAVIDPQDKSLYFAGSDRRKKVSVWKLDAAGKFAQIVNQEFPDSVDIALCVDDKPYLVTSTYKKKGLNATLLTAYAIEGSKLEKLWSHQAEGMGQVKLQCLKTADNWYVSDLYWVAKNPDATDYFKARRYNTPTKKGTKYYSAVMKFDNTGKFISQTKYAGEMYPWYFKLIKTKDGRIISTGTSASRPFVAVVN